MRNDRSIIHAQLMLIKSHMWVNLIKENIFLTKVNRGFINLFILYFNFGFM